MDHNEEAQLYLRNPCLAWLDAVYESDLSSKAKLIAGVLASHMLGSDECWPGMALIAQRSSYAKRTVINAIAELVEAGWLIKKPGGMDRYGGTSPNRYRRLYPKQGNVVDLPSEPITPPSEIRACTDITEGGSSGNSGGNQSSPPRGTSCPLNRNRNRKEIEKNVREGAGGNTPEKTPARKRQEKVDPLTAVIPDAVNPVAWREWWEFKGGKPVPAATITKTANQFISLTPDQQQAMVDASIANQWRGLFPDKFKTGNHNGSHSQYQATGTGSCRDTLNNPLF